MTLNYITHYWNCITHITITYYHAYEKPYMIKSSVENLRNIKPALSKQSKLI